MHPPAARRVAPAVIGTLVAAWSVVAAATPAAAHSVEGGELPAPTWLFAYGGAFLVLIVAALLTTARQAPRAAETAGAPGSTESPTQLPDGPRIHVGNVLGTLLYATVVAAAIIGPDSAAANIAPLAVLVGWWIGLPIACLLVGDVMAWVNPFQLPVAALQRLMGDAEHRGPATAAPRWAAAAFLGSFAWFFLAYHHPGSPRALAVFLLFYAAAAVVGGLLWGRAWLVRGEGFGALSAAVAQISWRSPVRRTVPGLAVLMVVWLGATAFDAVTSTTFWLDVLGTARGWTATMLNTVGLVWLVAIVGGAYLGVLRLADRSSGDADDRPGLPSALALALVPIATAWFLTHDLTLLLWDGQNLIILLSDPIARGWDLFGTINRDFNGRIVEETWVRWLQVAMLATGHVLAVVLGHSAATRLLRPRPAVRAAWALAGLAAVSVAAAVLLVLGG